MDSANALLEAPQRKRKKRDTTPYPDSVRAEALAALRANRGNVIKTSREIGIPEKTLEYWSKHKHDRKEHLRTVANLRDAKLNELATCCEDLAWDAAGAVKMRICEASARDAAVVLGIMVEKTQLLRGLPTDIHATLRRPDLLTLSEAELAAMEEMILRASTPQPITVDAVPCLSQHTNDDGTVPLNDGAIASSDSAHGTNGSALPPVVDSAIHDSAATHHESGAVPPTTPKRAPRLRRASTAKKRTRKPKAPAVSIPSDSG